MSMADEYLEGLASPFWWKKENRRDVHSHVWATVEHLIKEQQHYENMYTHLLRMYSSRMASGFFGQDFSIAIDPGNIIRMNAIKSCIDTSVAQIAAERARPMHLVQGASHTLRDKAEKNDKYVLGIFTALKHFPLSLDVFRDGDIWGSGWEKWYTRGNQIVAERVPATEVVFDDNECRYGTPQSLFHVKDVDPDMLADRFKKKKQEIRGSKILREGMYDYGGLHKPVTAIEAWHLPSGPQAKDGLHTITTSDAQCLIEPWTENVFPLQKWDWQTPPFGMLGLGMAEDLSPMQIEINYIAQKIQRIFNLAASRVWIEKGSQIGRLDNKDISVGHYKGRPPVIQQLGSVSGEFFNHLDRLYARCFEQSGISQLQAQGLKPAGLDSGEALRVIHDIGSRRFKHVGQRWADYHVECGKHVQRCSDEIVRRGGKIEIVGEGGDAVEKLNYADIRLPENEYLIKRFPVSLLPDEPAGKLELVAKIVQMVPPEMQPQFMGLMSGIPDVEPIIKRMTAPYDAACSIVERILTTGTYEPPRAGMNTQLLMDLATKEMNHGWAVGIPEERLEVLQRFIADIGFLEEQMQPPPVPPDMAGAAALPGAPPSPQAQATPPAPPMAA